MRVVYCAVALSFAISVTGESAVAAPIADRFGINIVQWDGLFTPNRPDPYSEFTTATAASNTFSPNSDIQAIANFATGEVGSRVKDQQTTDTNSRAAVFDTIRFDTGVSGSARVSFDWSYKATLSATSSFQTPLAASSAIIYDITGLSMWLQTQDFFGAEFVTPIFDQVTQVARIDIDLELQNSQKNGNLFPFDVTLSESFLADSSREYGIAIISQVGATGLTDMVDALNTGAFRFTDLDGATVEYGSGVFLSDVADLPEPKSIALFATGLVGLGLMSRRRRRI